MLDYYQRFASLTKRHGGEPCPADNIVRLCQFTQPRCKAHPQPQRRTSDLLVPIESLAFNSVPCPFFCHHLAFVSACLVWNEPAP